MASEYKPSSSKKRGRKTVEEEDIDVGLAAPPVAEPRGEESARKRPRLIDLNPIVATGQNLETQLTELGANLALIADAQRSIGARRELEMLKQKFNEILESAFTQANQAIIEKQEERRLAELSEMEREESYREEMQRLRNRFINSVKEITDSMSTELTIGEQVVLFNSITMHLNDALRAAHERHQASEPDHLARLSEISAAAFNSTLTSLSSILTNIYRAGPEKVTQLVALLAASSMAYNYLPPSARDVFTSIPTFGPLFQIMNTLNSEAVLLQNSAATLTTIFYLLRNSGLDPTSTIACIGDMTRAVSSELATKAVSATSTVAVSLSSTIMNGAVNLMNGIASRLGNILMEDFITDLAEDPFRVESQPDPLSQESVSSSSSFSSSRVVDINSVPGSQISELSQLSVQSVSNMLNTPIEEGGISPLIPPPDNQVEQSAIDARFQAIDAAVSDPVLATEIVVANAPMPLATVMGSQEDSQRSVSTMTSSSSSSGPFAWLFADAYRGSSTGGKRMRKSRRRNVIKKTSKRKGRKNRKSKKVKRHNKTIKRYRVKRG